MLRESHSPFIGPTAEIAHRANIAAMRFPEFAMERMQSTWEHRVKYDLSESGLEALTLDDAVRDLGVLGKERLRYADGLSRGKTPALHPRLHSTTTAACPPDATQDNSPIALRPGEWRFHPLLPP